MPRKNTTSPYGLIVDAVSRRNLLLHASPLADIDILEPRTDWENTKYLFATENLSESVIHIIKKCGYPHDAVRMQTYSLPGRRNFVFCSVQTNYLEQIRALEISLYLCRKEPFAVRNPITSRICRLTGNLIMPYGCEWITTEAVVPLQKIDFSLDDLPFYGIHGSGDSKAIVLLKYLGRLGGHLGGQVLKYNILYNSQILFPR